MRARPYSSEIPVSTILPTTAERANMTVREIEEAAYKKAADKVDELARRAYARCADGHQPFWEQVYSELCGASAAIRKINNPNWPEDVKIDDFDE